MIKEEGGPILFVSYPQEVTLRSTQRPQQESLWCKEVLYCTWCVETEIEDVDLFGNELVAKLVTKLTEGPESYLPAVAVFGSVRYESNKGRRRPVEHWKVSLLVMLEGAHIPVSEVLPMGEEYDSLVSFFAGEQCLDVDLEEFQVVQSDRYKAVYACNGESEEMEGEVNLDMWRVMIVNSRHRTLTYLFESKSL